MNRLISILVIALLLPMALQAQTKKVAIVQPQGDASTLHKSIVRGSLRDAIASVDGYEAFTRTDIDDLMKEYQFQQGGMVSDAQRARMGRMDGVDMICAIQVTTDEGYLYVESQIIELQTGKVYKSESELMEASPPKIRDACIQLAAKLVGQASGGSTSGSSGGSGAKRNGAVYNPDGIELVYVEGSGSGIMATQGFYIGKFEVTQAQWQAIMGNNPSNFKGTNLPVEMVSWNDAQEFLSRLNSRTGRNYRLPTEAEWEFAARGGTAQSFCGGSCEYSGSNNIHNVAWFDGNSGQRTQPVGTKQANELGIHDMSGNVWEWCQDLWDRDSNGSSRVIRGGDWGMSAGGCRVAHRFGYSPDYRDFCIGFRLVLP